ncbi:hypothetical protein IJD34_05220 [bacterium]|nr:hypothetical protein [bacterium]
MSKKDIQADLDKIIDTYNLKNNNSQSNTVKKEVYKILNNSTDSELIFYLEMIKTLSQNVELLKK